MVWDWGCEVEVEDEGVGAQRNKTSKLEPTTQREKYHYNEGNNYL